MLVDPELIRRVQAGDAAALAQVVTACRLRIRTTLARLLPGPEQAEIVERQVVAALRLARQRNDPDPGEFH